MSKSVMQASSSESMLKLLMAQIDNHNSKFMSLIEAQSNTIREIITKLEAFSHLSAIVAEQTEKLSTLDTKCNLLTREIENLRETASPAGCCHEPVEIIVSGLPLEIKDSSAIMVEKVFHALEVSEFSSEILDIRSVSRTSGVAIRNNNNTHLTQSVIVKLKSRRTRDNIIDRKRQIKDLPVSTVFESESKGKIFVNEFLPRDDYKLLRKAKLMVSSGDIDYVWCKSGKIFARKNNGLPAIILKSDSDLSTLVTQGIL